MFANKWQTALTDCLPLTFSQAKRRENIKKHAKVLLDSYCQRLTHLNYSVLLLSTTSNVVPEHKLLIKTIAYDDF